MKWDYLLKLILILGLWLPVQGHSQEEESAEISLEENTDEFQEYFFEAIKQKGIENYDKAINALLRCKELDPDNHVVDHELAKTYQLNNQIVLAQEYALTAVKKDPGNLWYLNTYVTSVGQKSFDLKKFKEQIPIGDQKLKENLASILVERKQYETALELLKQLEQSKFKNDLLSRISDSLERKDNESDQLPVKGADTQQNTLIDWEELLLKYLQNGEFDKLNSGSAEALEAYPLQPFFYYTKGLALNRLADFKQAEEYLLMGLDFIFEDDELTTKVYRELATTYQGLGDATKANLYLSKLKNGS